MILNGILRYGVSLGQREAINKISIGIVMGIINLESWVGFIVGFLSNYLGCSGYKSLTLYNYISSYFPAGRLQCKRYKSAIAGDTTRYDG